jgi:hypothetical protein
MNASNHHCPVAEITVALQLNQGARTNVLDIVRS